MVDKTEKNYLAGKYDKAEKSNGKYRKKVHKKLGKTHYYLAEYITKKDEIDLAYGTISNLDDNADLAIRLVDQVKEEDFPFYLKIHLQIIESYIEYQHFVKAQEILEKLESEIQNTSFTNSYYDVYIQYLDARIKSGKGFNQEANRIFKELEPKLRSNFSASEDYFDISSRTLKKVSPSKVELLRREYEYSRLLASIGSTLGIDGEFERADSAFTYSIRWIRKNFGRTHIGYFYCLLENARIDLLKRDFRTSRKELNEVIANGQNSMSAEHYLVTKAQLLLIENLIESEKDARSENEIRLLNQRIRDKYPASSIYRTWGEFLKIKQIYETKDLPSLEQNVYKILTEETSIPEFHPIRNDLLEFNLNLALINQNYDHASSYLQMILNNKKELVGENSPYYHFSRIDLADYKISFTNEIKKASEIFNDSYTNYIEPNLGKKHPSRINLFVTRSKIQLELNQFELAENSLKEALEISADYYGTEALEYGILLDNLARIQIKINDFVNAKNNLDYAIEILRKERDSDDIVYYSNALETQAMLVYVQGYYDDAIASVKRSQRMYNRADATQETTGEGLEILAKTYVSLSKLSQAERLLETTIKNYAKRLDKDNKIIISPLLDYSDIFLTYGEYSQANEYVDHAIGIALEVYGEKSIQYTKCLIQKAKLSSVLGDYERAEEYINEILEIQRAIYGSDHLDIANSLTQLGLIKYFQNQPINEIENLFLDAETIIIRLIGSENPLFAEALKNLGIIYMAKGDYTRAKSLLSQSKSIWQIRAGKRNNLNVAEINVLLGDVSYMLGDYMQAEELYKESHRQYKKFFNDNHPKYVKVTSKLSKTYFMMGKTQESKEYIDEALENYNTFIKDYFPGLSERQKAKFWNSINSDYEFYNTIALKMKDSNPEMIANMYNNALTTKALLLNTSLKIRERILNTTDEELHSLYFNWKAKKEDLTNVLAMSIEEQQEENINPNKLKEEIEEIERQLSLRTEGFAQSIDQKKVTWENVRNTLKPNEVAVEMIRFRYFNKIFTDSVVYAAVYITNKSKNDIPDLFTFPNGRALEHKWLSNYRNSIVYRVNDKYSNQYFWQPFERELGTLSTIYLSSDGVFNQLNLESIPTNDGKYVLDNSNIILVNNTKDLYFKRIKTQIVQEKKIASLVGNPKFYASAQELYPAGGLRGNRINDLPGTRIEISELDRLLVENGWTTNKMLDTAATEINVKKINNPKVFHIATHGFFTSDQALKTNLDGVELSQYESYENPLLRSGLMLTGAGDLLGTTAYNYNIENGILTAYEAMNLNLDHTELVVLSACETGLGDVETGEGVYGLQRAFLVAGAKSLIMSLFKVSDDATQKLMIKFYQKWLTTGNKRQAFIDAKKEIRTEFRDPIYWGAFIMIGLD